MEHRANDCKYHSKSKFNDNVFRDGNKFKWLLRHRFDAGADARRAHAPLLAIVADRDSIIPRARSQALFDAWAGPKAWLVVPATDHNSASVPDAFWTGIARFLGNL